MVAGNGRAAEAFDASGCPEIIVETFGERHEFACYVAWRESSYRADATGKLGERGWFQIHPIHGANSTYETWANTQYAYRLSDGGTDWCTAWKWTCE